MISTNELMKYVYSQVFDEFCPKMQSIRHKSGVSELRRRVCSKCNCYYPTLKVLQAHVRWCRSTVIEAEEEDPDLDEGDDVALSEATLG